MTRQLEDFDFAATCRDLGASTSAASAESQAASTIAGHALHYLFATGQLADFRHYLRITWEPASLTVGSRHIFDGMEQAEQWLNTPPEPAWGTLAKVAGRTYVVARRTVTQQVLLPSFTLEELQGPP